MKKYKWLIILGIVILTLVAIIFIFSEDENKYVPEISVQKILKKIEKEESFILYIKQTTCSNCKSFSPKLIAAVKENNIKDIYSINITDLNTSDKELFNKNINITGTPTMLFFIEGNESMIRLEGNQSKEKIIEKLKSTGFIDKE